MDAFLSNLLCMLLPVIYIIVISCVRATDVVTDSKSRRLMNEVSHVIDVASATDSGLSSGKCMFSCRLECSLLAVMGNAL